MKKPAFSVRRVGAAAFICAISILVSACSAPGDSTTNEPVARQQSALGVPNKGFPSWQERMILMYTNRARADPAAELTCTQCPDKACYTPVAPLVHNLSLAKAARFQSTNLVRAGSSLRHTSTCTLVADLGSIYPESCDGDPSCACEGGSADCDCRDCKCPSTGCTAWNARIARFGVSGSAENIAAGYGDPRRTFEQWIWEPCAGEGESCALGGDCCSNVCDSNKVCVGNCGWSMSNGHRANILKASLRQLGVGHEPGFSGCYSNYWTQDFSGAGVTIPAIPAGAHYPQSGIMSTTFTFSANYYDLSGAPTLARVVIEGTCYAMTLERGSAENGTLTHARKLPDGCHRYYFYFKDASGALVTYPSEGSFGVQVGGGTCADYDIARPSAGAGCGCSSPADCDDGDVCTTDACSLVGACQNTVIAGCCTIDGQCSDGDVCTEDRCASNTCSNPAIAGCCTTDGQCADSDVCTNDRCTSNRCANPTIAGCCTLATECVDSDVCTEDLCTSNRCENPTIAGCCTLATECADNDACTEDLCTNNRCVNPAVAGCCTTDATCDDGDVCTNDTCAQNVCAHSAVLGCCNFDVDCNDGKVCTRDGCVAHACTTTPVTGCCETATECDDSNGCTEDGCVDNVCVNTSVPSCCAADADCADDNPCTVDHCDVASGACGSERLAGCCAVDTECDDSDICTTDRCEQSDNTCVYQPISGCGPDAGVDPDGGATGDGGALDDGGMSLEGGTSLEAGGSDASVSTGDGVVPQLSGGCGCVVEGATPSGSNALWLLL
ncbi:MAG: CAP domain-containing protein, partial [Deltaproteobacteria bacterium]|nr:CAP domain-containing protein [Deltaproteobacteria bacterium]